MLLFTAETPPITSPLITIVIQEIREEVEPLAIEPAEKIYTIDEKIDMNFYECDESLQYIRADTATCLAKPVYTPPAPQSNVRTATVQSSRYVSSNNTYAPGNCTAFVKDVVSWIPNGLGNANQWDNRASSFGLTVDRTPRAGSVGVSNAGRWGHVFRVDSVNSDGTINITEMNRRNLFEITSRVADSSAYVYIYP